MEIVAPLADDLHRYRPSVVPPAAWLFPGVGGRLVTLHNWRERNFHPAARAARVEALPHDLRHSYVSALIHEGRSLSYVATMAGHSPRLCADRYPHSFAEAQLGTAKPLAEAIREARAALGVPSEFSDTDAGSRAWKGETAD